MPSNLKEIKNEHGEVVQQIDFEAKKLIYIISKKAKESPFKKIVLEGFTHLPNGFYKSGFGLTSAGQYFVRACKEEFGDRFELSFSKTSENEIKHARGKVHVVIHYPSFALLLANLKEITREKNKESRDVTRSFLNKWFPETFTFESYSRDIFSYTEDKVSKILNSQKNIEDSLSKADINSILEIYPRIITRIADKSAVNRMKLISSSKAEADRVLLDELITEFERKLKLITQSENDWQIFLQKHMLLFNTSYVSIIEKASVSLQGKFPDFMLVDLFNYIDIFEIKKPTTTLLKHDISRNNYHWDTELSRAIIQVENYISLLLTSGAVFEKELKKKDINVNVLVPRGVIIAGSRSQLKNKKMEDDFRLLKNSLKNIDVILYDDFLERLKNLKQRIS